MQRYHVLHPGEFSRCLTQHNAVRGRRRTEPRRQIDGVSDNGIFHTVRDTDITSKHLPAVDADAQHDRLLFILTPPLVDVPHNGLDQPGAADGLYAVFVVGFGYAE